MAKHLTEQDRQQIVGILDGWPADSKLTWDRLLDRIGHRLGINPTRQTLSRDPRIKLAFQNRKEGKPHPVRQSATEKSLRQKVERLKAENARLEKEKGAVPGDVHALAVQRAQTWPHRGEAGPAPTTHPTVEGLIDGDFW